MAENPGAGQGPEKSLPARLSVPMLTDAHRRSVEAAQRCPRSLRVLNAGTHGQASRSLQGSQVPEGHQLHAAFMLIWF